MAVGATVSLLLFLVVVLSFRSSDAGARETIRATDVSAPPSAIGSVALLTPEREVPPGTKLSTIELKEVYWPRNQVPEGAIRDLAEVKALYSKMSLPAGQPIVRTNLSETPVRGTLPLTKGYRAVSIEVDATAGIEGHALPGTRVDVVLTHVKDGNLTSKVIIQNSRVLSYGGDDKSLDQRQLELMNGPKATSSTITLEVIPNDALKLQTARQLGRLSLTMRAPDDELGTGGDEVDANDLEGNSNGRRQNSSADCLKGSVRIDGKEFLVDCRGQVNQVIKSDEP